MDQELECPKYDTRAAESNIDFGPFDEADRWATSLKRNILHSIRCVPTELFRAYFLNKPRGSGPALHFTAVLTTVLEKACTHFFLTMVLSLKLQLASRGCRCT